MRANARESAVAHSADDFVDAIEPLDVTCARPAVLPTLTSEAHVTHCDMPRQLPVFTSFYCICFLTLTPSCSSNGAASTGTTNDTGTATKDSASINDAADGGAGTTFKDHGVVLDYISRKPLAGITLTESGVSAKTDEAGAYSLDIPANKPVELVLSGGEYTKTFIGELMLGEDYERKVPIPLLGLFHVGEGSFDGFDHSRGIVYVVARATGACTSVDGGKITLKAPSDARYSYFTDKLPDADRKEFKWIDDDTPVAAVYNVPPGQQIDVQIDHPSCKQIAFPAKVGGTTYTGRVTVEAGDANSVLIYYLQ